MTAVPTTDSNTSDNIHAMIEATSLKVKALFSGDTTIIADLAIRYVFPASVSLLAVFVGYLVAKYFSRVISTPVCKRVDETLGKFIGRVVFYGVLLSVVAAVLNIVGFEMAGIATVIAAAGFAIGLAFQGTLSNFAAGVLLLVFRPFKVGDMINAAGMTGRVNEIDLFTTTLDTPDNRRIIIPNSSISGGTIENISFHKHRRVEVLIGVEYAASLDATRAALIAAAESLAEHTVQGTDRGYQVILANMADSSVQWKVRVWAATSDYFLVNEQLTQAIKQQLDAAEISIPFPQMDVHLHRPDATKTASALTRMRPRLRGPSRGFGQVIESSMLPRESA